MALSNTDSLHILHIQERIRRTHLTCFTLHIPLGHLLWIPSALISSSWSPHPPPGIATGPLRRYFFLQKLPFLIFLVNGVWSIGYSHGNINLDLSPCRKINSRWLVHISTNDEKAKLLEGNLGEHLIDWGKQLFLKFLKGRTTKKRMMNWTILKIRTSVHQMIPIRE